MAKDESQLGVADSAAHDIGSAVKMGAETAKTAKTIAKAASMAASQNYVGAALAILKDPATVRTIIIIILIPILFLSILTVFFLYALPTVIFEALVSYFDEIGERWSEVTYAGGGNVVWNGIWATIKTGGSIIGDAAQSVWNGIKSLFTTESGEDTGAAQDTLSDDGMELQIVHEGPDYVKALTSPEAMKQGAEYQTLLNKIDACKDKITARESVLYSAIQSQVPTIQATVNAAYASEYDSFTTRVNIQREALSDNAAIELLSLYTVQTNASLQEMKLSDLMKWLGWNGNNLGNTTFALGDLGASCSVKTWKGEFLPQYLVEQEKQEKERNPDGAAYTDFSQYKCAAVDLVIVVDCPNLSQIPITRTVRVSSQGVVDADGAPVLDPETGEQEQEPVTETIGEAVVNISIHTRSVSGIAALAGLWDGALYEEQTMPTYLPASGVPMIVPDGSANAAGWIQSHIDASGNLDATARQTLFGDSSKTHFSSAEEAAPFMRSISIPIWKIDNTGAKYSTTCWLTVHSLVANDVQAIFEEIFNDPEQFPFNAVGGARFTDTLRHSWGCAIDINPYENCECNFFSGGQTVTCGYGWWPEGLNGTNWVGRDSSSYHGSMSGASVYSIRPGGSVVRAFAHYGWGWGGNGWYGGQGFDFMHFSVLSSGG